MSHQIFVNKEMCVTAVILGQKRRQMSGSQSSATWQGMDGTGPRSWSKLPKQRSFNCGKVHWTAPTIGVVINHAPFRITCT